MIHFSASSVEILSAAVVPTKQLSSFVTNQVYQTEMYLLRLQLNLTDQRCTLLCFCFSELLMLFSS